MDMRLLQSYLFMFESLIRSQTDRVMSTYVEGGEERRGTKGISTYVEGGEECRGTKGKSILELMHVLTGKSKKTFLASWTAQLTDWANKVPRLSLLKYSM